MIKASGTPSDWLQVIAIVAIGVGLGIVLGILLIMVLGSR